MMITKFVGQFAYIFLNILPKRFMLFPLDINAKTKQHLTHPLSWN